MSSDPIRTPNGPSSVESIKVMAKPVKNHLQMKVVTGPPVLETVVMPAEPKTERASNKASKATKTRI